MTEQSDGTCTMCRREEVPLCHIPLYTGGSEGIFTCQICEDALNDFIGMYMRIFTRQKIEAIKKKRERSIMEDFEPTKMAGALLYRWRDNKTKALPCSELLLKALNRLNDAELDILANSACAYVWLNTRSTAAKEQKEFEDELERQNQLGRV